MVKKNGGLFAAAAEVYTVNSIKEKLCRTALEYEKEIQSGVKSSHYELPDGSKVTVSNERIMVPEAMFKPSLIGMNSSICKVPVSTF